MTTARGAGFLGSTATEGPTAAEGNPAATSGGSGVVARGDDPDGGTPSTADRVLERALGDYHRAEHHGADAVFSVPLARTSDGGYEALLPPHVNAFTFFWTEPPAGPSHPGHWEREHEGGRVFTIRQQP